MHFYTLKAKLQSSNMAKTKKIDKEYCLTDSTVNCYGFRLLTSGYQRAMYESNPIGYYMHYRDEGVVVRWEDFRIEGDKVFAKPVINLSNKRGEQTVDEVENGFLNGASVGHIVALEYSEDPKMMIPGQTGPTITKWYNRECSLVDVPGNMSSLCLFDKDGNEIKLADFQIKKITMEKLSLSAEQLAKLNLKATSTQTEVDNVIADLSAKAAKADQLEKDLNTANSAKETAETQLADYTKKSNEKQVADMLSAAVTSKKITVEVSNKLKAQFEGKPELLKDLLDAMPVYTGIVHELNAKKTDDSTAKMTYSELDKAGKLEDLKANNPELFKQKFKEAFGKDYKD